VQNRQTESLIQRLHQVLKSGLKIAVFGWRDSNHNDFTRKLSKKKIIFLEISFRRLPTSVAFVLLTGFISHAHQKSLIKQKGKDSISPIPFGIGEIKVILEACADLLGSVSETSDSEPGTVPDQVLEDHTEPNPDELNDEVLEFLTAPRRFEMSNYDEFTASFLEEAKRNKKQSGLVGKKVLSKLRKQFGIEASPPTLISGNWIVPQIGENKRQIGWYKAGPQMLDNAGNEKFEPSDPLERMKYLISIKPDLQKKLEEMKKQKDEQAALFDKKMAEIREKIEKCLKAEEVFQSVKNL